MKRFLVFIWGGVDSNLRGPFKTDEERNKAARALCQEEGDQHGYFSLDIDAEGNPTIYDYSSGFFDEDEDA